MHSLKELVMSSVCMETSGEPLVTAWTAQYVAIVTLIVLCCDVFIFRPGSARDIVIGYERFVLVYECLFMNIH